VTQIGIAVIKLKQIRRGIIDILVKVATRERAFIEQLNREQLEAGINADGSRTPNYAPDSASPSAPGRIKRLDTGEYFESLFADIEEEGIDVVSTDPKAIFMNKWGEAQGLTKESQEKLAARMIPQIREELRKLILA
jgi:hypothetical protein